MKKQSDKEAKDVSAQDKNVQDRRTSPRMSYEGKIRTRVTEINLDTAAEFQRDLECQALDACAMGVQFSTDLMLNTGVILDLTVENPKTQQTYQLTGEVRWVSGGRGGKEYLVGMQLFKWLETDINEWQQQFEAA